jgi:spermidine synthase
MSVGLTEISLEILAIMAYQSMFGFLYSRIALLTGLYMIGLALGAWIGTNTVEKNIGKIQHLAVVQTGMAFLPLLWAGLLVLHSISPEHSSFTEAGFYILITGAGIAGGFQFPLADFLYRNSLSNPEKYLGVIYSLDLAGSSVGALVTASLMIPVLGMNPVLIFLSALNLIIAFSLWLRRT